MKKLKKRNVYVPPDQNARRNRLLFAAACVGALALCVAIIFGYWKVSSWFMTRNLERLNSAKEDDRVLGMRDAARAGYGDRLPRICDLLRTDRSQRVRGEAVAAIARMGNKKGVPSLIYALGDETDAVANESMVVLQKMVDKNIDWSNVIEWWNKHRSDYDGWAYQRPEDTGVPVVDAMQRLLKNDNKYIRFGAVERLAKLKHSAAAPALTAATADSFGKVRSLATDALKAIASRTAH